MSDSSSSMSFPLPTGTEPHVRLADEAVVRGFVHLLDTECERYCILSGYDTFPMHITSDIDFMVNETDFKRLPRLLSSFADLFGYRLIQVFDHEVSARCYTLARYGEEGCTYLSLDSASDYRRCGRKWLEADDVLACRRQHPRGFWIPSSADGFIYCLLKRVERCDLGEKYCLYLSRTFMEDPQGCCEAVRRHWSAESAERLCEAACFHNWSGVSSSIATFARELSALARTVDFGTRLMEFSRKCRRLLFPTGCWIAVAGPAGSGKSSLIAALGNQCIAAFNHVEHYSLCFDLRVAVKTNRSGVANRNNRAERSFPVWFSRIRLAAVDYIIGYWLVLRPQMVSSTLVAFDQCSHDSSTGFWQSRRFPGQWLTSLLERLTPLPDLILVLDAPSETLQQRQSGASFEDCIRQRAAYKKVALALRNRTRIASIDTSQPLDECVYDATREIFHFLESRTRRRCRIVEEQST
jgi:thymidylate kinase